MQKTIRSSWAEHAARELGLGLTNYTIEAEGCYPRTITARSPQEAAQEYISRVRRRTDGQRQLTESDARFVDEPQAAA